MREMLAQHRANPVCASCHAQFDVFGLAFEGYGPVGEARTKDLAGRPVDAKARFPRRQRGHRPRRRRRPTSASIARTISGQSQPQAAGLRAEPLAAALRRASRSQKMETRLAADGYRFDAGGNHRHQPAVPEPAQSRIARNGRQRPTRKGEPDARNPNPESTRAFPAAPFFAAPGCTMALPWLPSLCRPSPIPPRRRPSPSASRVMFMGNGINEDHWSAEGSGADMKLSKTLSRAGAVEAEDQRHRRPLQPRRSPARAFIRRRPAACSPARTSRRAPSSIRASRVDQMIANTRGAGHPAIQHRAGLRAAHDGLPRDQLLAGLQLAHLLADARFAGAGGSLPFARLRQPVRQPRQPAEHQHSRPREGSRRGARAARSAPPTRASSTSISPACAKWKSASTACARPRTRRTTRPRRSNRPASTMERPANGLPEDLREHARLMCDIIAIAFQTDQTRVASLISGARSFGACTIRSWMCRTATTPPRTTTIRTATSASLAST